MDHAETSAKTVENDAKMITPKFSLAPVTFSCKTGILQNEPASRPPTGVSMTKTSHKAITSTPHFNERKFRELLLYVADKCEQHRFFGAVKLNKVLFYSDFLAYKLYGKSITGAEYYALELGPGPRALVPIRDAMIKSGDIAPDNRMCQNRLIALRDPNLEEFSAQEIALVDKIISTLKERNAGDVTELSHAFLGWKAAWAESQATGKQVVIPYGTAFVDDPPMDEFEEARGLELAKKHGWSI